MSLYISFDIEMNGDTPMLNNMLSIGMVGITGDGEIVWKYETGFEALEGHEPMEQVMNFWLAPSQANAWRKVQELPKISPMDFYTHVSENLTRLSKKYSIEFVAWPANFDWMFFKCYYELGRKQSLGADYGTSRATGYNIGYECLDASELFNAFKIVTKITDKATINRIENQLMGKEESLAHDGLYDAICQGLFYIRLLKMLNVVTSQTSVEELLNVGMSITVSENIMSGGSKRRRKCHRRTKKLYKKYFK